MPFDINDIPANLASRIKATAGGCWEWTGTKTMAGYGQIIMERKRIYVHRYLFGLLKEPLNDSLELDHLCRCRNCCNPDHLEQVTHAENVRRGACKDINGTKTHCPKGHPYDEQNTISIHGGKHRDCLECKRRRCREYMRRKRAK